MLAMQTGSEGATACENASFMWKEEFLERDEKKEKKSNEEAARV